MNDQASERHRYRVLSGIEVPLTIEAADWGEAVRMAIQILGRERVAGRFSVSWNTHGVTLTDPENGELISVVLESADSDKQAA